MSEEPTAPTPGRHRIARTVFSGSAWLFAAGVLLQVYFAGLGILVDPTYFDWHVTFAHLLELAFLALLVAGLIGRVGAGALLGIGFLFALYMLQYAFVEGYDGLPRGLHAVNAFALFWVALRLARNPTAAPWGSSRTGRFAAAAATALLIGTMVFGILTLGGFPATDGPEAGATEFEGPEEAREVGSDVYVQHCVACHGENGDGGIGPALTSEAAVANTESVVRQILEGGAGMPAFQERLSAREVAAVATFVRSAWGNDHPPVEVGTVEALR